MSSIASPTPKSGRRSAAAALRAIGRQPAAAVGGGLVAVALLVAVAAPWLAPYPFETQDLRAPLQPPFSRGHPLGTDHLGRDVLSRVVYGARVSLLVGVLAATIAACVGVPIGMAAGYRGGRTDAVLGRAMDAALALPPVLLGIGLGAIFRPGQGTIVAAIGLVSWGSHARVVRAEALALRQAPFVEAARAVGCDDVRILTRHLLPNLAPTVLVLWSLTIAGAILSESVLSFLGVGIQPPRPSWGAMLLHGSGYVQTAWWLSTIPGLAIVIVVLGFTLFGDGLRDLGDPRVKRGR